MGAIISSLKSSMKKGRNKDFSINLPTSSPSFSSTRSIRSNFKPLAIFAKAFGLFPCYDLDFVEKFEDNGKKAKARVIHIVDYIYSILLLGIITGGALLCTIKPPSVLLRMQLRKNTEQDLLTDYYVNMALVYSTMTNGVTSLLFFPSQGPSLLKLLSHFQHLDKIMKYPNCKEEQCFALRVLFHMIVILFGSLGAFVGLYIMEIREEEIISTTDYVIPSVLAVSGTVLLIPSGLVVFFLNALRFRLLHFNQIIEQLVKPITPSCYSCTSYEDYCKELEISGSISIEIAENSGGEGEIGDRRRVEGTQIILESELAQHLDKMRILHAEFGNLASELGCIFGGHLVRDFLFSLMGLILYTYLLIYMNEQTMTNWFIYLVLDSFLVIKIVVMTAFAQRIGYYGVASEAMMRKVSFLRLGKECRIQVQMFLDALSSPIQISAAGYFTIDRRLLTSILGAITTYFIILIQFKVGNGKQELQALTSLFRNYSHLYDFITDSGLSKQDFNSTFLLN